ncbi:MAG: hypothetical protein QOH84_1266, partial [Kribbellaceae bacterium]|nr:hypothetical protein [Kribbellaceae bacterium]
RSSCSPTSPRRPSTSSNATPPTTGGNTKGTVTNARMIPRPGNSARASNQANGTPSTKQITIAEVAQIKESFSASPTSALNNRSGNVDQGA